MKKNANTLNKYNEPIIIAGIPMICLAEVVVSTKAL
jgi:hypothetical protein